MDGVTEGCAECDMLSRDRRHLEPDAPSTRLFKARLAAGFRSGKAAALAKGWKPGTYAGDESGARDLKGHRAQTYAAAFGVPEDWLMGAPADGDDAKAERARALDELDPDDILPVFVGLAEEVPATSGVADRLVAARRAAGFQTAAAAARHLGWTVSTVHGHENGQNNPGSGLAKAYGLAYGADPYWILTGRASAFSGPSTRGEPVAGRKEEPDAVRMLAGMPRPRPRGVIPSAPTDAKSGSVAADHLLAAILPVDTDGRRLSVATVGSAPARSRFRKGDRVVVDPDAPRTKGCFVALDGGDGLARVVSMTTAEDQADVWGTVVLLVVPCG